MHRHEPGCGVRAAVERGEIAPQRYRLYAEILDELTRAGSAQPRMLASVSSASSSIHSTTERHTRPTTLCRWRALQRHAGGRAFGRGRRRPRRR